MSLKTWKKEFYSIPAWQCGEDAALDHSVVKWIGLLPKNLKKHGLKCDGCSIRDEAQQQIIINSNSCALCFHFDQPLGDRKCEKCPLAIVRGGVRCDKKRPRERNSPFYVFMMTENPRPMLKWLRKAVEAQKDPRKVAASCGDDSMPRPENKV